MHGALSSKLGSSKPIEKVRTFRGGSTSQSAAATLDESTPPEKKTPSGTSERRCRATDDRNSPQKASAVASKSVSTGDDDRRLPVASHPQPTRLPTPGHGPAAACVATARSNRAPARIHRRGNGPGSPGSRARPISGCASTALGSEPKASPPPRQHPVEQRLLAHAVPRQDQSTPVAVPDRQREHPVEPPDEIHPFFLIEVDQALRVRRGPVTMALRLQVAPQLQLVVELAVVADPDRAVLVRHRLSTAGDVDDREPAMPQRDRAVAVDTPRRQGRGGSSVAVIRSTIPRSAVCPSFRMNPAMPHICQWPVVSGQWSVRDENCMLPYARLWTLPFYRRSAGSHKGLHAFLTIDH